jgi:acetoin utilization deacetylase AcuC-like enzyme
MPSWRWPWSRHAELPIWYEPDYRLPLSGIEGVSGMEPRRADFAAWYLDRRGALTPSTLRTPLPIPYEALGRVHAPIYLESLHQAETLAAIFAVDPSDVVVDELLHTVRLACGATLSAAREALLRKGPTLNLLGGFHHAAPHRGAGFCALNDVAVAVAALREEGFAGQVVMLDLDAHPPDGTAECLAADSKAWIGSLSGSDWGPLAGNALEVLLPQGTGDTAYLAALESLIEKMPRPELAFVIAGGDVLAGDRLGLLGMSVRGARKRDLRVAALLDGVPSVWLPGGGYGSSAWRVLAGTGVALAFGSRRPISSRIDPLHQRFVSIAAVLRNEELHEEELISADDLAQLFGHGGSRERRLLGFYTREGIEYALHRYGLLKHLERLGYQRPRVELDSVGSGDRVRLFGVAEGEEHVLVELVVERRPFAERTVLFLNWLSLRHPRARFSALRPQLPGQDVPGLGVAREVLEMVALMARRLVLDGVALRPSWFHTAYASRHHARFLDPRRQGRFEAMVRDLKHLSLLEATKAVAEGRARLNGQPYTWEAEDMVQWLRDDLPPEDPALGEEREASHFTVESSVE